MLLSRTVQRHACAQAADRPQKAGIVRVSTDSPHELVAETDAQRSVESLEAREQTPALPLDLRIEPDAPSCPRARARPSRAEPAHAAARLKIRPPPAARARAIRRDSESSRRRRGRRRKSFATRRCATDPWPRRTPDADRTRTDSATAPRGAATAAGPPRSRAAHRRIGGERRAATPSCRSPARARDRATRFSDAISVPACSNSARIARVPSSTASSDTMASATSAASTSLCLGERPSGRFASEPGRLVPQLELHPPAVIADLRFAPELERADLGERGGQAHRQFDLPRLAPVAQHGDERRVLVRVFVRAQRDDARRCCRIGAWSCRAERRLSGSSRW